MKFPPHLLDDVRARLPVSVVVGRRVKLTKAGREWRGLSPFQKEKTPSFYVNDQKGFYHCFSSGKHGDIFRFVMETEGLSFPEAVERLAAEAGVEMPKATPEAVEQEKKRRDLYDVMELAAKFFEAELQRAGGANARAYLIKRGFTPRTQAEFRMGFAPESREALLKHLAQQGVSEQQMIDGGLVIEPEDRRGVYDRFRNRLMIPIQDNQGRVVAFGGRVLDPEAKPKYLNSPETSLFKKGFIVFNGHRAREAAFKVGTVIATEGYLDAIAVHQAGMRNVVATLGTAFTEEQIATLWRYAPEPIICFDGDKAGLAAANRTIDRILPALKTGFSFRFAILPEGQDPDDMIKTKGVEAFAAVTSKAMGLWDALWLRETTNADVSTPDRQAMFDKRMRDLVALINDPLVKRRYELQSRLRVGQLIWATARADRKDAFLGKREKPPSQDTVSAITPPTLINIERIFLGLCVHYPDLTEIFRERIMGIGFQGSMTSEHSVSLKHVTFIRKLLEFLDDSPQFTSDESYKRIYEVLDVPLMDLLEFLHGMESPNLSRKWGYNLMERFPVLKSAPDETFIESCFHVFIARFEQRDVESEFKTVSLAAPADADDEWFNKQSIMMEYISKRDLEIYDDETKISEEANQIIKSSQLKVETRNKTYEDSLPERLIAEREQNFEMNEIYY